MDTLIRLVRKVETDGTDSYGDVIYNEVYTDVFAEETSVGFSEFYQAMTNGYKPEKRFLIYDLYSYHGEDEVISDGVRYKILRVYNNGDYLEVVCYGGVHVGFT